MIKATIYFMYLQLYYEHILGFKHFDVIIVGALYVLQQF